MPEQQPSLSARFAAARQDAIEVGGRTIYAVLRRQVQRGTRVRVSFLDADAEVPQGLSLSLKTGAFGYGSGARSRDIVLWRATAPDVGELVCRVPKSGAKLSIWNCWQDKVGVTHAWLGNCGMLIEELENGVEIRASHGYGDAEFNALLVRVEFLPPEADGRDS